MKRNPKPEIRRLRQCPLRLLILIPVFLLNPRASGQEGDGAKPTTLRVGIYQNHPKVFLDEDGQPRGIFVDIISEIARREDWLLDYVPGNWSENIARLTRGEIDLLVDVSFSPERAALFVFHENFVLESWLEVYHPKGTRIDSVRDLHGKTVSVLDGSIQEKYLREDVRDTFDVNFDLLTHSDYPASVRAVKSGTADVLVAGRFFHFSPDRDEALVPAHVILRPENLYFAFRRDIEPRLVEVVDGHLAEMKNDPDSPYYQSLQRWLDLKPPAFVPRHVKLVLAAISGLLAAIGLFSLILRLQVKKRTAELNQSNEKLRETIGKLDRRHGELNQANRELRRTHRLLQETQALTGLGGWEYDVATGQSRWTREMYDIFGVEPGRDPGETIPPGSLYPPAYAPIIEQAFRRAVENGEKYDLELELVRPDGEKLWVRSIGNPVIENGKVVRIQGNLMDITQNKREEMEKRKLQNQLVLAQKMELVGRLAGGVAHDFNNMLGAILGYAELALLKVDPDNPLREDLREILKAAQSSASVTRQLLAFARKETIAPEVVDLNKVVGGMLKMLRRLIGENIVLEWRPGDSLWPIRIDPSQVDQVLVNLCVNARDAIADVGRMLIETTNVSFEETSGEGSTPFSPGDYVLLCVTDSGSGMDKATLDKIFEPFFTTKESGHGTGLGLATVFGIVKQNNGFINVYSEPAQGTSLKVYLPRYLGKAVPLPKKSPAEMPRSNNETILLVEDEPAIRRLTLEFLADLGYNVLVAEAPDQALPLSREHPGKIDLLITDVLMPGMNGRELAERIRRNRPGIKCLFMSGYAADFTGAGGLPDDGAPFIQKPFSLKLLATKVREVLDSEIVGTDKE